MNAKLKRKPVLGGVSQKQKQTHVLVGDKLVPIREALQRAKERERRLEEWRNQLRDSKSNQ